MGKRTPEQFLAEEGMTIETAKRIYNNIIHFMYRHPHLACTPGISPMRLIQEVITNGTYHGGGTSARQILFYIDEDNEWMELDDLCDPEICDYIDCCMRCECEKYKNAKEEKEEGLRDFNEAKTTHNAPKKNTGQIYRVWKVPNTPRVGRRVRDQLSYPQFQDSTIWDESGGSVDKA